MAVIKFSRDKLIEIARNIAKQAHCPYSGFRVGAAVVAAGKVYTGVNIENSSYGLTLCAERAALASAISAGATRVTQIVVSCIDADRNLEDKDRMPCGACRQWMADLAPNAEVIIDGVEGTFNVRELLPRPFGLSRTKGIKH